MRGSEDALRVNARVAIQLELVAESLLAVIRSAPVQFIEALGGEAEGQVRSLVISGRVRVVQTQPPDLVAGIYVVVNCGIVVQAQMPRVGVVRDPLHHHRLVPVLHMDNRLVDVKAGRGQSGNGYRASLVISFLGCHQLRRAEIGVQDAGALRLSRSGVRVASLVISQ